MALKRIFPITPDERNTPASPNETGNSIPREGPLPAQVDDTEIVISTVFPVDVNLIVQAQVVDLTGGDVCESVPTGCKPVATLAKDDAPLATLTLDDAPLATLAKDDAPLATLACRATF